MKKNVIALAIASAVAAPVAMADAPTLFGQLNAGIENTTDKGTTVNSYASRVGVKGSEDLGNGLKAVYHLEWGVDIAGGKGATASESLSARNAVVGLAGGFGTVLLGRHDTPLKMSQAKDLFNDGVADMGKPAITGGLGVGEAGGEVRAANVLAYVSPTFAGISLVAAGVSPDMDLDQNLEVVDSNTEEANLDDAYSIALMYGSKKEGLYLSAAYNNYNIEKLGDPGAAGMDDATELRISAQYAAAGLIANLAWQEFKETDEDGTNIQAQVGYKMGKFMPKLKYSTSDFDHPGADDGTAYAIGLDYSLGKKTKAYIEYMNSDENMQAAVTDGASNDEVTSTVVGIVHKF
ncbi:porin [Thiomicrorhabdus xiamenensis]|uniref:Porin n=1 Tax=Thiomicrorhabdus xiamenensis TaxID=2739063 RepID=A0A7D4SZX7_9GAMM|nr:porin [Thiomicrorhabdus xiamenensis]QKI88545.1 porin [Thiomicrorhabdus xiamenensis]